MTPGLVAELEHAEVKAWTTFYQNATPAGIAASGLGSRSFGAAIALWMSKVDDVGFNRVIGLGLDGPPDTKAIEELVSTYERAMVPRFLVQLAPLVTLGPTLDAVTELGFARLDNWVRLVRDVASPGPVPTHLRVEVIEPDRAALFAETVCAGFGMGKEITPLVEGIVGLGGWHCYLAYDGDRPVASAVMVVDNRIAWLGFASTLPEARGQGAQSSLIARRILDARTAGCEYCCAETDEQTPERLAPSYRNVMRAGFEVGYLRPNYLYRFQQRDSA